MKSKFVGSGIGIEAEDPGERGAVPVDMPVAEEDSTSPLDTPRTDNNWARSMMGRSLGWTGTTMGILDTWLCVAVLVIEGSDASLEGILVDEETTNPLDVDGDACTTPKADSSAPRSILACPLAWLIVVKGLKKVLDAVVAEAAGGNGTHSPPSMSRHRLASMSGFKVDEEDGRAVEAFVTDGEGVIPPVVDNDACAPTRSDNIGPIFGRGTPLNWPCASDSEVAPLALDDEASELLGVRLAVGDSSNPPRMLRRPPKSMSGLLVDKLEGCRLIVELAF